MGKIIYKELSYEIVGVAFDVFSELGYGFKERYYEEAMAKEFCSRGIRFERQIPYNVKYKDEKIGRFVFDFLVEDKIIVELKRGNYFSRNNITQVVQYLKVTELKLGILINMTQKGVQFKRIVNIR